MHDFGPIHGGLRLYVCACVYRALVAPVVKGVENLPDPLGPRRPLLFIGHLLSYSHPAHWQMHTADLAVVVIRSIH